MSVPAPMIAALREPRSASSSAVDRRPHRLRSASRPGTDDALRRRSPPVCPWDARKAAAVARRRRRPSRRRA